MNHDELDPGRAYDLWAATYDTDPNPMVALSAKALSSLSPPPRRVLELGCGTGRNLAALAARGATTLAGVDLSDGMLAIARARLPGASFWRASILDPTPLDPASVDLVLITLVLEHVADPSAAFAEAHRVLAPGGRLVVIELHPDALSSGSRAHFEGPDGATYTTAAFSHTAAELGRCARGAGFPAGHLVDLHPDDALAARFPSKRRPPGLPWLLQGTWTR
jgi:ubiquinone/menaquinone biosynthesis C-methylase UbiE